MFESVKLSGCSTEELVRLHRACLEEIQAQTKLIHRVQHEIASRGRTRRKMLQDGVPWVGY